MMRRTALWKCTKCGRSFANRNQSHFCARHTLRGHLSGKSPQAIALFQNFVKLVRRCGPVRVLPEKTRIAFQVRMSFAAVRLLRDRICGHVVLARHLENPRFIKVEHISPRNHVHSFCFRSRKELDRAGSAKRTALASRFTCEQNSGSSTHISGNRVNQEVGGESSPPSVSIAE